MPMFLFNVGLLTLMNMDSLIFLAKLCPLSLLFGSYYDWWGGLYGCCVDEWVGVLWKLFMSFTKCPGVFLYVFIITREVTTLEPINGPIFADHWVFVLGGD